jgi:uncharacterized membrane protein SirB2
LSFGTTFDRALEAVEQAGPIAALRESTLAYPLVNALHIVGIALLFGAIVALDLRLIGWRRAAGSADAVASLLLPVAITGLLVATPAGLLLFATDARAYAASPLFQAKMLVVALAIANALWLRASERRRPSTDQRAAIAAAASILLWLGAIVLGRLVGYF